MITEVLIHAYVGPRGSLTTRVSYADSDVDGLVPPLRFWRSSVVQGVRMDAGPGEAIFWVMEQVADINYSPGDVAEPDPFDGKDGGPSTRSWAVVGEVGPP